MADKDRTKIKNYLEENGRFKDYATFLNVEPHHLKQFLKYDSPLGNKDVAAFYAFSGIHPSDIGIERDMNFFPLDGLEKYDFLSFSDWRRNGKKDKDFIHRYFQTISEKVAEAKKRIFIFDLLIDNGGVFPGTPKAQFFEGYESYFKVIEKKLASEKIKYTRILGFPNKNKDLEEELDLDGAENESIKTIKLAIALLFEKTFEHICNQFKNNRIDLFILPVAPRNYSLLMLDHKYVMTEYFRIRRGTGKPVPDILFINHVDVKTRNPGERLMSVYDKEFQELIDDRKALKVEAGLFCQCTMELLQKVEENIAFEERKNKRAEVIARIEKLQKWKKKLGDMVKLLPEV